MTTGTLAIASAIPVSPRDPPSLPPSPLGIAALIAWLVTASIGGYMLRTWIARGGLRRQRATGVGVPPAVVFGHASAALTGLVVWVSYLASGWSPVAWLGVLLIGTAITLGICMVTLWTPYPIRPDPKAGEKGEETAFTAVQGPGRFKGPVRPEVTPGAAGQGAEAAPGERPDGFTVTDEMIARLLSEPMGVRRRRRLPLLPLIPACHGFAAMATFLLVTSTAIGARLGAGLAPIGRYGALSGRLEPWQKR
jgi:manganese efflux pump family protein